MGPSFTIVVIACNVGTYIRQCLDSILSQKYGDFDVLIGVENSDDDTAKIADACAAKHKNVSVEKMERSGSASRIRNFGIENARGEYLLFVDGDDWIEPGALEKFSAKISEFGTPDVVPAAATEIPEDGGNETKIFCGDYPDAALTGVEYLARVCPITRMRTATWMSAYRTEFLRGKRILQCDGRRHQDDEWTPRVYLAAQSVAPLKFAYYNYRKRPGSVTTKANPKSMRDIAANMKSFMSLWRENRIPEGLKPQFATWNIDYAYRFFSSHSSKSYPRELRRECFMEGIGNPKQFEVFRMAAKYASPAKKLMLPICALAAKHGMFGFAEFIFRRMYSPLVFWLWPKISSAAGRRR